MYTLLIRLNRDRYASNEDACDIVIKILRPICANDLHDIKYYVKDHLNDCTCIKILRGKF